MLLLISGLILTIGAWFVAWSQIPILTEHSFFPLWLGYILVINGLSEKIFGGSLLSRMRLSFIWLFVISMPMWWGFEYLNSIVHNWQYVLPHPISDFEYFVRTSVSFSTVVPAVLSTAFFFQNLLKGFNLKSPPIRAHSAWLVVLVLASISFFVLVKIFPHEAFPLIWIAPLLLLEPILYFLGSSSLLRRLESGEWSLPVSLLAGTLFTGFWWEFWNFYSMPKWIYIIPYVDFWRIFEMPILGYGGYPLFGLIVYTYAALVLLVIFKKELRYWFITYRP